MNLQDLEYIFQDQLDKNELSYIIEDQDGVQLFNTPNNLNDLLPFLDNYMYVGKTNNVGSLPRFKAYD